MSRRRFFASSILILVTLFGLAGSAGAQKGITLLPASTGAVEAAPAAVPTLPAEALDDPWLADDAPVENVPVERAEERAGAAWRSALATDHARAAAVRRVRLEAGLGDLPGAAVALAAQADPEEPEIHSELALGLAPDRPAFSMAHAIALQESGDTGAATLAFMDAGVALVRSLASQLWLVESLSHVAVIVLLVACFAFFLLVAIQVASHAAHDLGDLLSSHMPVFARYALLAAAVLAPVVFGEGLLGLALALFTLAFWYGSPRQRNALVMAAVFFVIGLHSAAQIAKISRDLVDEDPVVASVFRTLADQDTVADRARLEAVASEDRVAAHALAYRDRRQGLIESSRERLLGILEAHPSDAIALANLGNIEKRRGNDTGAIDYYERAAAVAPDATLLFNLSQSYASVFRMEEYERTIARAQRVDDRAVAALSEFGDAELVADLGYPTGLLYDRFRSRALAAETPSPLLARVAPGLLRGPWWMTASAFALITLSALLFSHRWDHSSLCTRCGHRICTRCEDTVWNEEICEDCHRLFHNPEAADPSLRMARLQELSERDVLFDRIWLALSLLVPGMAGFAVRRPDVAMLSMLLFGWAAATFFWPAGPFADPMLMGSFAWFFFALPGLIAALIYTTIVVVSLIVRRNA